MESTISTQNHLQKKCDPFDPFQNPTENHAFRTDYRDINPLIDTPGYEMPLLPERNERKRIRHYFNTAGLVMLLCTVFVNAAFIVVQLILECCMTGTFTDIKKLATAESYINNGSVILLAMNGLLFLIANTGGAVIGCRTTDVRIRSLFRGDKESTAVSTLVRYALIGIFIQAATGLLYTLFSMFMESSGVEDYTADIDSFSSLQGAVSTFLYGCIVAPVTEELFYRGFVMKALSRVSVRFGIVVSALLFGLTHENLSQFMLAFPMGIFMGRIVAKHNSLIPSIAVHIAVNTFGTMFSMLYELTPENDAFSMMMLSLINLGYYAVAVVGLVLWIFELRKNRLPANTIHQSYRGIRIALTSPWLIAIICVHFGMAVLAVALQNL